MTRTIVAFQPSRSQPPVPQRARPDRLRALPQFSVIVAWIAAAVLHHRDKDVLVVRLEDVAPALVDQVTEETVRTLAALDPIAESAARHRARKLAGELLAKTLSEATEVELADADYLRDRGNAIADAVLERYRGQLVYGATSVPVTEVKN